MTNKSAMGRPTKYTPVIVKKALDYLDNYEKKYENVVPSVIGMARVLDVNKSTLHRWAEDKENNFCDILERCKNLQEEILINGGLLGDFNPSIVKLMLGKHGYHDKQDSQVTGAGGQPLIPHNAPMVKYVEPDTD